jgi:hypothetical protein
MSINLADQHVRYSRIINFDKEPEHIPYCDEISDTARINDWHVTRSIDPNGKIEINATKSLDEYKNHIFDEANIQIKLSTTTSKAPPIKAAVKDYADSWSASRKIVTYVEVPDGKDRWSDSLGKDVFVEKHYRDSSVLSVKEYFDELMPKFDEIIARYKVSK